MFVEFLRWLPTLIPGFPSHKVYQGKEIREDKDLGPMLVVHVSDAVVELFANRRNVAHGVVVCCCGFTDAPRRILSRCQL